jgi:hypothetical protein
MPTRDEVIKEHRLLVNEYERWNSYRVHCACGWREKAMDEHVGMSRYRNHVNSFVKKH